MSLTGARRTARLLALLFYYIIPIRRGVAIQQLRFAFPELDERSIRRIAFESYLNLTTVIVELLWFPNMNDETLMNALRIQNPDVLTTALKKGKGLLLISGHVGNWELLAFGVARLMRTPTTIIIHPQENRDVAELVNELRCRFGNRVVDMRMGVREVIRTIRARGIVAMLTDQSGPSNALYIDFFGRPAATYEGPAAIALKMRAPLIMILGIRQSDGHYDVHLKEFPIDDLKEASDENIYELTRRHVRYLEECVRSYPGQWLWQHRRWKHKPSPASESKNSFAID